jgi:hypothetical protein
MKSVIVYPCCIIAVGKNQSKGVVGFASRIMNNNDTREPE